MQHDELGQHIPELQDKNTFTFQELEPDAQDRAVSALSSHTQDSSWREDYDVQDIDALLPKNNAGEPIVRFHKFEKGPLIIELDTQRNRIRLNGYYKMADHTGYLRLLGYPDEFHGVPGIGIVPLSRVVDALESGAPDEPVELDHEALTKILSDMIAQEHDEDFGFERPTTRTPEEIQKLAEDAALYIDKQFDRNHVSDEAKELTDSFDQDVLADLESRHEHATSRESVVDMIEANDYRFDHEGNLA